MSASRRPVLRAIGRPRTDDPVELRRFLDLELIPLVTEMRAALQAGHLIPPGDNPGDTLVWNATTATWETA